MSKPRTALVAALLAGAVFFGMAALPFASESAERAGVSDGYPRQSAIDIVAYRFYLSLFDEDDEIEGVAIVELASSGASRLELDLVGVATVHEARAQEAEATTGMTVTGVERLRADSLDEVGWVPPSGEPLDFQQKDHRLHIELGEKADESAPRADGILVAVHYRGAPADGLVISQNRHGDRTFFGDNWPDRARHWLPVIDHPYDKARVGFVVEAPAQYQVVASGALREATDLDGGRRRTWWQSEVPLATKVMVIGVARFAVEHSGTIEGIPVSSWVYPQDRARGFDSFAPSSEILRFFVDRLGDFPYAKLASVQSTTRYGGMENAGNIFYYERSVEQPEMESLIAHEIAHQWFGDSVSEYDWHHVWLSEGFATYLTVAWLEARHGEARMRESMAAGRKMVIEASEEDPRRSVLDRDVDDLGELLGPAVYQRGAWVLHMLRREVGDEAFWQGVAAFASDSGHGNALTSDFQTLMERAAGRELDDFFAQWLERPELPRLEVETRPLSEGRGLEVVLSQVQPGAPFDFWVDVELVGEAAGRQRVRSDGRETRLVFPRVPSESEVLVDPDVWLLFEGEPASN